MKAGKSDLFFPPLRCRSLMGVTFSSGNSGGVSSLVGGRSVPPGPVPFRMNRSGVFFPVVLLKEKALTSRDFFGRASWPPGRTFRFCQNKLAQ